MSPRDLDGEFKGILRSNGTENAALRPNERRGPCMHFLHCTPALVRGVRTPLGRDRTCRYTHDLAFRNERANIDRRPAYRVSWT